MLTRRLGRSELEVGALGFGTYGLSGMYWEDTAQGRRSSSYGPADDQESTHAIQRALEGGINFFDTADEYGCGHAERLLGHALAGRRHEAVIATKFGYTFDEATQTLLGEDASREHIRQACQASLRRLQTDYIDVFLFHLRSYPLEQAGEVRQALEDLVAEGKIRWFGWSTDDLARARFFAESPYCTAVEHALNVFMDNPAMLGLCEELDLGSINRIPLLSGVLAGKFLGGARPQAGDRRGEWTFEDQKGQQLMQMVDELQALALNHGRSLAQLALGWIWHRSPRAVPVPGMRTTQQVEENLRLLELGPLPDEAAAQVKAVLERYGHRSPFESK